MKGILFLTLITHALISFTQSKKEIKLIRDSILSHMIHITGGEFTPGDPSDNSYNINKEDTNLLFKLPQLQSVSVNAFYISEHETTNAEYNLFKSWVKDSLQKINRYNPNSNELFYFFHRKGALDSIDIYIPTTELLFKTSREDNEPFWPYLETYDKNKACTNYPVLGCNWHQANAYCHWLTNRLNQFLSEQLKVNNHKILYRLPTAIEWEYSTNNTQIFNWNWNTKYNALKELANYGKEVDQHGLVLKNSYDDGHSFPSPIKYYPANLNNIYDLSGNASEWTSTTLSIDSVENQYETYFKSLLSEKNQKYLTHLMADNPDYTFISTIQQINPHTTKDIIFFTREIKPYQLHNQHILKSNVTSVIVKGGSYSDPLIYLMNSSNQVYPKTHQSSKIGFRPVLIIPPSLLTTLSIITN